MGHYILWTRLRIFGQNPWSERTQDLGIHILHTSGVNVGRAYVLLANEMQVLDYYASTSDQSWFGPAVPLFTEMFLL